MSKCVLGEWAKSSENNEILLETHQRESLSSSSLVSGICLALFARRKNWRERLATRVHSLFSPRLYSLVDINCRSICSQKSVFSLKIYTFFCINYVNCFSWSHCSSLSYKRRFRFFLSSTASSQQQQQIYYSCIWKFLAYWILIFLQAAKNNFVGGKSWRRSWISNDFFSLLIAFLLNLILHEMKCFQEVSSW